MSRAVPSIAEAVPKSHQKRVGRSPNLSCCALVAEGDGVVTTIKIKNARPCGACGGNKWRSFIVSTPH